jgi:uncharacterized membrane protein
MEKKWRSILKAITWRMIGTMVLATVSYFITGSIKHMTLITIVFECIQLINYYWHERLWMRIKWGKILHPLQELPVKKTIAPEHMEILRTQLRDWGYLNESINEKPKRRRKPVRVGTKILPAGANLKKEMIG